MDATTKIDSLPVAPISGYARNAPAFTNCKGWAWKCQVYGAIFNGETRFIQTALQKLRIHFGEALAASAAMFLCRVYAIANVLLVGVLTLIAFWAICRMNR